MKKYFYTFIITLLCSPVFAQTITNGGFENWNVNPLYEELPPYTSTNSFSYFFGSSNLGLMKTTDKHSGTYAAIVKVIDTGEDTIAGALFLGNFSGAGFSGGVPFTDKPDSLVGYAKFNLPALDTAKIIVAFKKSGNIVGFGQMNLTGAQGSYTRYSVPITFFGIDPDTLGIFIFSTSLNKPLPDYDMYMDDFSFVGGGTFPNGDFESWNAVITEDPAGWVSSNFFTYGSAPSVYKTTDKYSGTYAATITTQDVTLGEPISFLINGKLGPDGPMGGQPVQTVPVALRGYYKYAPAGNDTGVAVVSFFKWNDTTMEEDSIAELRYYFTPTSTYKPFLMGIFGSWSATPDSVLVGFSASNISNDSSSRTPGSTLKIDDIRFDFSSGLSVPLDEYFKVNVLYPNPATETVSLEYTLAEPHDITIRLYDVTGRMVNAISVGAQSKGNYVYSLDVAAMPAGTYFYSFNAAEREVVKKFTIVK